MIHQSPMTLVRLHAVPPAYQDNPMLHLHVYATEWILWWVRVYERSSYKQTPNYSFNIALIPPGNTPHAD